MRRLLLVAASLLIACSGDPLQKMKSQPKYLPYQENPLFQDGRAMRQPPEGTVPRERLVGMAVPAGATPDGHFLATIPISITPELMARGQKRFTIHCAVCHGVLGDGVSMVSRNMALRPPPSLHDFRDRPDGFFYDVITNGYGLMASYANEIPEQERWAVVAYVRALQRSQNATLQQVPAAEQQRLQQPAPQPQPQQETAP
jgi:mono/diheme cytochrome c family protein